MRVPLGTLSCVPSSKLFITTSLIRSSTNLDEERRRLTDMLTRFRISYSEVQIMGLVMTTIIYHDVLYYRPVLQVTVIPLQMLTWAPDTLTMAAFSNLVSDTGVGEEELARESDKTNRSDVS